jgi:hypothetical protein
MFKKALYDGLRSGGDTPHFVLLATLLQGVLPVTCCTLDSVKTKRAARCNLS